MLRVDGERLFLCIIEEKQVMRHSLTRKLCCTLHVCCRCTLVERFRPRFFFLNYYCQERVFFLFVLMTQPFAHGRRIKNYLYGNGIFILYRIKSYYFVQIIDIVENLFIYAHTHMYIYMYVYMYMYNMCIYICVCIYI